MVFETYRRCDVPDNIPAIWIATGYIEEPRLNVLVFQSPDDFDSFTIVLCTAVDHDLSLQTIHKQRIGTLKGYLERKIRYRIHQYNPDYAIVIKNTTLSQVINILTQQLNATMWVANDF